MTRDELIHMLIANHNLCTEFICCLQDEQFMYTKNGKWSAGQQLAHLILCLKPISQALSSPAFIQEKFGVINRPSMSYDQVIIFYKEGLQMGGKAPDKFLPAITETSQRQTLRHELSETLSMIQAQLHNYSDDELDSLALPHPFLGLLSIRELLYLMSYHPLHHLDQVKANVNGAIN